MHAGAPDAQLHMGKRRCGKGPRWWRLWGLLCIPLSQTKRAGGHPCGCPALPSEKVLHCKYQGATSGYLVDCLCPVGLLCDHRARHAGPREQPAGGADLRSRIQRGLRARYRGKAEAHALAQARAWGGRGSRSGRGPSPGGPGPIKPSPPARPKPTSNQIHERLLFDAQYVANLESFQGEFGVRASATTTPALQTWHG